MEEERLQKYMASCGVASRRACEEIIRSGRVRVNGKTASLGMSVDPGSDWVEVDGKRIRRESRRVWIMLYKPRGVVSTSSDPQNRKTVQDCVKGVPERLFHMKELKIEYSVRLKELSFEHSLMIPSPSKKRLRFTSRCRTSAEL